MRAHTSASFTPATPVMFVLLSASAAACLSLRQYRIAARPAPLLENEDLDD
jgi:hypothetical protein